MNREFAISNDKSDLVISVAKKNTIEHVFFNFFVENTFDFFEHFLTENR